MVLYILTGYLVLGIAYLDKLSGARHTSISSHDTNLEKNQTVNLKLDFMGEHLWSPEQ